MVALISTNALSTMAVVIPSVLVSITMLGLLPAATCVQLVICHYLTGVANKSTNVRPAMAVAPPLHPVSITLVV